MIRLMLIVLLIVYPLSMTAEPEKTEFLVSYIDSPATNKLKQVISNAYLDIGIRIRYIEMPVERRFIELDKGYIDADLGGRTTSMEEYEIIVSVDVPLINASMSLVCPSNVTCDNSVFENERISVYSNSGHFNVLLSQQTGKALKSLKVRDGIGSQKLNELFENERLDYFILTHFEDIEMPYIAREHQKHMLVYRITVKHLTHKQHQPIHNKLKEAIEKQLKLMVSNPNV